MAQKKLLYSMVPLRSLLHKTFWSPFARYTLFYLGTPSSLLTDLMKPTVPDSEVASISNTAGAQPQKQNHDLAIPKAVLLVK